MEIYKLGLVYKNLIPRDEPYVSKEVYIYHSRICNLVVDIMRLAFFFHLTCAPLLLVHK